MSSSRLIIAPIVEGHGDVAAVPVLLRRIVVEFGPGTAVDVLQPIRQPRSRLIANSESCLTKAVGLAELKLRQRATPSAMQLVLILLDADDDCAAQQGPAIRQLALGHRPGVELACVLAVSEYETWFVAAAESLQ